MTSSLPHLVPLAKQLDEDKVTPGVLGFLVFAALGVAVWFLMKSMNRQFTRINFEEEPSPERDAGGDGGVQDAAPVEDGGEPKKKAGNGAGPA